MVSGFASFIMNLRQEFARDYIIFVLDSKGKTLRHEILGEYKANLSEPPAAFKFTASLLFACFPLAAPPLSAALSNCVTLHYATCVLCYAEMFFCKLKI